MFDRILALKMHKKLNFFIFFFMFHLISQCFNVAQEYPLMAALEYSTHCELYLCVWIISSIFPKRPWEWEKERVNRYPSRWSSISRFVHCFLFLKSLFLLKFCFQFRFMCFWDFLCGVWFFWFFWNDSFLGIWLLLLI